MCGFFSKKVFIKSKNPPKIFKKIFENLLTWVTKCDIINVYQKGIHSINKENRSHEDNTGGGLRYQNLLLPVHS